MRRLFVLIIVLFSTQVFAYSKPVLGPSEVFHIGDSSLPFTARIDTGASNSSLHAVNLNVVGGAADNKQQDIGKFIRFTTADNHGQSVELTAKIVDIATVKNAQGTESRYMVALPVGFGRDIRTVNVNLRDRSHMDYKLLIGRNWVKGHYLVDVDEKPVIGAKANISVLESNLVYQARIDTGAVETSLHATNIHIAAEDTKDMRNNIGKEIRFTTSNEAGQEAVVTTKIVDTSLIRNSQGSEVRYMVDLSLGEPGLEYKVRVNLRDRTKMSQKLLIGRNWLSGHYVVDVERHK
ncbi:MAG: RimK/LysX family protein [Shewanella sp.]